MREYANPPLVEPDGFRNATDLLVERLRAAPAHIAFEVRTPGAPVTDPWRQITTRAFTDEVRDLAKGFIAAGIQPGESLALMAPTRYEWAVADLAAWFAGAVVVPVYETSALPQVAAILADASVRLAVGGTATEAGLLAAGFERAGATPLGVWTMDPTPGTDLAALICDGARISDEELESRRLLADLDSVATIVYTSGTTAAPRGATITHRNLVGQVLNIAATYTEVVREDGNTIIFLPLSHVLARALQLICLARGMRIAHLADPREVVEDPRCAAPHFPGRGSTRAPEDPGCGGRRRREETAGSSLDFCPPDGRGVGHVHRAVPGRPDRQRSAGAKGAARTIRPALLCQASCADGGADRLPAVRRRGFGRRTRPVLPRDRRPRDRGVRPHRNHGSADRQPAGRHEGRQRRHSPAGQHRAHFRGRRSPRQGGWGIRGVSQPPRQRRRVH